MKNIYLLFVLAVLSSGLFAQGNIGINDTNPDPLAILDIESTNKGVLIPRMTETDRLAIPVTADQNGLLLYQTDGNAGFWYYNGGAWEKLGEGGSGIADFGFASASGLSPTDSINFIGPTAQVTITAPGQKVWVVANKALGSTMAGGANGLNLFIGYRMNGATGSPTVTGSGSYGLRVAQNTRTLFGLSYIIEGLSPGTYDVGLAGTAGTNASNWNNNEYGYVTTIVFE